MKDRAAIIMAIGLVLLVAVEFLLAPRYNPRFPWHHIPGFAALVGLVSSIIVVKLSKALGKWLLQRPEREND
jgi:hypothetical protein